MEQSQLLSLAGVTSMQGYLLKDGFRSPKSTSTAFTVFRIWKMPGHIRPLSNAVERRKITSDGEIVPGTEHQTLIDELEAVIVDRNIGSRVEVLRRVTDLFVAGSGHYSDEQRALFDDVMGRLVDEIESSARAKFGRESPRSPMHHLK